MSSVYDPLGFISPFLLSAKIILQDLCGRERQGESSWPTPPARQENIIDDDLEIKREVRVHAIDLDMSMDTIEKLFCYFSSWVNLIKSMASLLRFKLWLLNKVR